ncbi:hypothetical protein [Maricaulis sp.]|uniref:hypothetical protein n=1 Tax=Maricaulis sp. TaxID=1486257 RepID=UPI003A956EB8
MILARITDALRAQNWTAIALEFLLVLSSVVLGFQVTAWNEARHDRQEATLMVARVADELEQSLQLVEAELPVAETLVEATGRAHTLLISGALDESNRTEFENSFSAAITMAEVRLHKSALEVFQNSGAANSGTPADLRLAIARYYEFVLIEREQDLLLLSDFTVLAGDLFDQIDVDTDYFSTGHIRGDLAPLNDNPALARTLLQINLRQQVQVYRLEAIRDEILALRDLIAAEAGGGDG